MKKISKGVKETSIAHFNGCKIILRTSQIPQLLQEATEIIMESLDSFLCNGFEWILQSIDNIILNSANYVCMHAKVTFQLHRLLLEKEG